MYTSITASVSQIEFYDFFDRRLLVAGKALSGNKMKEFKLEKGERVIGYQGTHIDNNSSAYVQDVQFVIGRLV
jgi:hypothetical protein